MCASSETSHSRERSLISLGRTGPVAYRMLLVTSSLTTSPAVNASSGSPRPPIGAR
ncbi:hypothetical protein M878_42615 [Streptomyces roseochromogenus subsp. oscitans DS 12.976]|uniref:Uncharacterized protein n=1 Tax=Streptomyces roseochromogenus subsp. oscitans DS 12.976 TaxID=1352936 RepID=V6JH30_STRRC|nr:hypothetical protein M878_42615 [Streptomyces roseochromogenus subsp. oscitans DS 12.976]